MKKSFFFLLIFTGVAMAERMTVSDFFNHTNLENMSQRVAQFYDKEAVFEDPVGTIQGVDQLTNYYQGLYQQLISIRFDVTSEFTKGTAGQEETVAVWVMTLQHKKLNKGEDVVVPGVSHIRWKGDKAVYHRDYFDLGAMVYEQVPVLSTVVRAIRKKMATH